MRKAIRDPNIRYDLLLTLLNRGNEARWQEHFRDALRKSNRSLTRNMRSPWQPAMVIAVDPVPPKKVGLRATLSKDVRAKVKPEQWHEPTDFYKPLCAVANLLIENGPGEAVADAFNRLTIDHEILAIPQVSWTVERFIPAWLLRPGGATDVYFTEFSDLLLSRWASRLRRCRTCTLYFIDQTRNGTKLRCSPQCTARHWNRPQRRNAGHTRRIASRKSDLSR